MERPPQHIFTVIAVGIKVIVSKINVFISLLLGLLQRLGIYLNTAPQFQMSPFSAPERPVCDFDQFIWRRFITDPVDLVKGKTFLGSIRVTITSTAF